MFYYTINKNITSIYNASPLEVVGRVSVYEDESKQILLTEIPFPEINVNLSVSECPTTSKEDFDNFVEQKALEGINRPEIQAKLEQVKLVHDLGLL